MLALALQLAPFALGLGYVCIPPRAPQLDWADALYGALMLVLAAYVAGSGGATWPALLVLPAIGYMLRHVRAIRGAVFHWTRQGAPQRSTLARPEPVRQVESARSAPATGATTVLRPLSRREWLSRVAQPTYPHRALTGGTRLGKTTMETALLASDPSARIVVCTPKAAWEDGWAGAPVVRPVERDGDPDWSPVAHATTAVYREMARRRFQGGAADQPIRLVLDEATEALDEIPQLRQQLIRLLKTGASVGIGVTLIDPELNVRAYGIEGRSDILASMLVLSVDDARRWSMSRGGSKYRTVELMADTDVRSLASAADLSSRGWDIPPYEPPPQGVSEPADSQTAADEGKGRSAPEELIEFLYTTKGLRDRDAMRKHLRKEYNFGLDNNRFTAVKRKCEGV